MAWVPWHPSQPSSGRRTVLEALSQPIGWLADVAHGAATAQAVWEVQPGLIRPDRLPQAGTLLSPEVQLLLSIRLIGPAIGREHLLASVIKRAVTGASGALKALVDFVMEAPEAQGRPHESKRRFYNLHAQRLAFESFEVGFALPDPPAQGELVPIERETILAIQELLRGALRWLDEEDAESEVLGDDVRALTLLRALNELSPPQHGEIQEIELGGRLVSGSGARRSLTRRHASRVSAALKETRQPGPRGSGCSCAAARRARRRST